jgi:hypothetical protein
MTLQLSNREINLYLHLKSSQYQIIIPNGLDYDIIKEYLLEQYKNKKIKFNKPGSKFYYNFVWVNSKLYCTVKFDKKNLYINNIIIPIKLQDYFQIKFLTEIKKLNNSTTNILFCNDGFLNEDIFRTEVINHVNNKKKLYRTDFEINICDNIYICIEFFEKKHDDFNDDDYKKERTRIYNLYHENNERKKFIHFAIFWEKYLDDSRYLKRFISHLIKVIQNYKDINNEKKWCVSAINKYIKDIKFAEQIYDAYHEQNEPIFSFDIIDKFPDIKWKNKTSKEEYLLEFINYIKELEKNSIENDIDDELDFLDNSTCQRSEKDIYYKKDKLTYHGLTRYLTLIDIKYLKTIKDKDKLIKFYETITSGFITGVKERYETLKKGIELIYGLYD